MSECKNLVELNVRNNKLQNIPVSFGALYQKNPPTVIRATGNPLLEMRSPHVGLEGDVFSMEDEEFDNAVSTQDNPSPMAPHIRPRVPSPPTHAGHHGPQHLAHIPVCPHTSMPHSASIGASISSLYFDSKMLVAVPARTYAFNITGCLRCGSVFAVYTPSV